MVRVDASNSESRIDRGVVCVLQGRRTLVTLTGEFDLNNAVDVANVLDNINQGPILLDLSRVTFCSSALLTGLLRFGQRVASRGDEFHVTGVSDIMLRLLDITRTSASFPPAVQRSRPLS
jgi:anti-anti-sigma factor